jgi:hypothetical protein
VEAGELIPNPMSKMKEKEEMAVEAVDGVMMLVEAVEVAITGVETTTPTWLLQTQIGEAEAVEDVVVAVVEVDLQ